jgi:hypothetical protein
MVKSLTPTPVSRLHIEEALKLTCIQTTLPVITQATPSPVMRRVVEDETSVRVVMLSVAMPVHPMAATSSAKQETAVSPTLVQVSTYQTKRSNKKS